MGDNTFASPLAAMLASPRTTTVREILFNVEQDEESSVFIASWDEPKGKGGITTQGRDLTELQAMVREAVLCHFKRADAPNRFQFVFGADTLSNE